jgi:2-aminoadipate transaminase
MANGPWSGRGHVKCQKTCGEGQTTVGMNALELRSFCSMIAQSGNEGYWREPDSRVTYPFDGGYADPATFPVEDFLRMSERVLRTQTAGALLYGDGFDGIMFGYRGLRDQLAARAAADDGRQLAAGNVIVTSGAAQAISLAFDSFLDRGDVLAVEAPTWGMVLLDAQKRGADVRAIPVDDDGLRVEVLEDEIDRLEADGRRLKLLYTIAAFNTPTGVTLSLERRRQLLELAAQRRFLILEDNVYRPLRYDGDPVPTLFSMDESDLVFKVESFSKTVAAGLRLGWLTGHPEVVGALANTRGDLGVSQWISRMMTEYLMEGLLDPHLEKVNALYRQKRDIAENALHAHCDPWVRWRSPEGGFFLWVELDKSIDGRLVMEKAVVDGVMCRPGEKFFGDTDQGRQRFRLAFSQVPAEDLERGIALLGHAIGASRR